MLLKDFIAHDVKLPAEVEEGNIEYKYSLSPKSDGRLQQLITQLRWRLTESAQCQYMIGVADDGTVKGINREMMDESLQTLHTMCAETGAVISKVEEFLLQPPLSKTRAKNATTPRFAAQVDIVIDVPQSSRSAIKVAFVGASGSGKSTLVGVLSTPNGPLDDGCGSVRLHCLRHRHEVLSGVTSSLALEYLVFDKTNGVAMDISSHTMSESQISLSAADQSAILNASHVVQMMDLPGDQRYLKSTYTALTSWACPDWICIVTALGQEKSCPLDHASSSEHLHMSSSDQHVECEPMMRLQDSLELVIGLSLPFFVVITMCTDEQSMVHSRQVVQEMISEISNRLLDKQSNESIESMPSILIVDCVSGLGIDQLRAHFGKLTRSDYDIAKNIQSSSLFCVENVNSVPEVGTVLCGTMVHGSLSINDADRLLVGPFACKDLIDCSNPQISTSTVVTRDHFRPISIRSMHRLRIPTRSICTGDMSSLAVHFLDDHDPHQESSVTIHRGMMVIREPFSGCICMTRTFSAIVCSADHIPSALSMSGVVYCMGMRLPAVLVHLKESSSNEQSQQMVATFELCDHAEIFVLANVRLVFVAHPSHLRLQGRVIQDGLY